MVIDPMIIAVSCFFTAVACGAAVWLIRFIAEKHSKSVPVRVVMLQHEAFSLCWDLDKRIARRFADYREAVEGFEQNPRFMLFIYESRLSAARDVSKSIDEACDRLAELEAESIALCGRNMILEEIARLAEQMNTASVLLRHRQQAI